MLVLKTFTLTLISFLFIACDGVSSDAPTTVKSVNMKSFIKAEKTTPNEILNAINNARDVARDCHDGRGILPAAPALRWNSDLYASAYEHSVDLATSDTFSHYGSGTSSDITGSNNGRKSYFIDRIESNGYINYTTIGENVAGGQESIDEAVRGWIASPKHCTNLMNAKFTEMGVAVATNSNSEYGIYWTQSFGSKK